MMFREVADVEISGQARVMDITRHTQRQKEKEGRLSCSNSSLQGGNMKSASTRQEMNDRRWMIAKDKRQTRQNQKIYSVMLC